MYGVIRKSCLKLLRCITHLSETRLKHSPLEFEVWEQKSKNSFHTLTHCESFPSALTSGHSLQLRRAELDEQDKQEFLVWLKENSSYQIFIQLLGEQQQANMFIIWSPFSRANSTEAFGNHACMHLKWRKVGSRKMIMSAFFFFGLENLIDVNASYSRIFLWLWLCPYRCLFSSKRCTQFLLTKNTSNVSRAFVLISALDVHSWATRDRSIL